MSIYGNYLLEKSYDIDSVLESLNVFVCEDYTFNSLFINETFSINILNEGIDKKAILDKFKSGINTVIEKIKKIVEAIKKFISNIKSKVINGIMKKNREKAKDIVENSKKVNNESALFLNESDELQASLSIIRYDVLSKMFKKNYEFLVDILGKFDKELYDDCNKDLISTIVGTTEFKKKETIDSLLDLTNHNSVDKLKSYDDCMKWLKNNVIDNTMEKEFEEYTKDLEEIEKILNEFKKDFEQKLNKIGSITQDINMDNVKDIVNSYFNSKNDKETFSNAIKAAAGLLNYSSNLLYTSNRIISSFLNDTKRVFHAINNFNKED